MVLASCIWSRSVVRLQCVRSKSNMVLVSGSHAPPVGTMAGGGHRRQKSLQDRQWVLTESLRDTREVANTPNNLISLGNPLQTCHQRLTESLSELLMFQQLPLPRKGWREERAAPSLRWPTVQGLCFYSPCKHPTQRFPACHKGLIRPRSRAHRFASTDLQVPSLYSLTMCSLNSEVVKEIGTALRSRELHTGPEDIGQLRA